MKGNLAPLSQWLKEQKITEVECLSSDLSGIARGQISPTNTLLNEHGMCLPESVWLLAVKRVEHKNYKQVISSWEREFLLYSV